MEGYNEGWGMGENIQGKRSTNCMYKIDRRRLRIAWEIEKPRTYTYDPCT